MKFKSCTLILLLILTAFGMNAQVEEDKEESKSVFCINAEFRNRTELSPSVGGRNVLVPIETNFSANIWQRSRIVLSYKSDKLETQFSIQDVRPFVQNEKSWLSNNGQALAVHEAWAKYNFVNNEYRTFGIKLGRQEIKNPDARLMWHKDWNDYAEAHDAIMLECKNKEFNAAWQLGFSLNSSDAPGFAVSPKYRNIGYFNFTKNFGKSIILNLTDLFETYENGGISDAVYGKNTVGLNPVLKFGEFMFDGSFYYQHGAPATFQGTDKFSAMLYTVNGWYKLGKVNVGAGFDSYSGEAFTDDGTDNLNKIFSAPLGAGHKFFGNTDFHLKLLGKGRGLTDINLKVKAEISKNTGIYAAFNMISFQQMNVYLNDAGEQVDFNTVGNNIDLVINHSLAKKMVVKLGYSVMLPSEDFINYSLGYGGEAKFHGWAWLMFSFKPNLLKVEK